MTDIELKRCGDAAQSIAIDAIEKILSHYSKHSAIGAAFDGCITIARANIRNGTKCGYRRTIDALEREILELRVMLKEATADYHTTRRQMTKQSKMLQDLLDRLEEEKNATRKRRI